jgi:hypothetical protein
MIPIAVFTLINIIDEMAEFAVVFVLISTKVCKIENC